MRVEKAGRELDVLGGAHGSTRRHLRANDVVAEATMTVLNASNCIVHVLEREAHVLEKRDIQNARRHHIGHGLALSGGEPCRPAELDVVVHDPVQVDGYLSRDRPDIREMPTPMKGF